MFENLFYWVDRAQTYYKKMDCHNTFFKNHNILTDLLEIILKIGKWLGCHQKKSKKTGLIYNPVFLKI